VKIKAFYIVVFISAVVFCITLWNLYQAGILLEAQRSENERIKIENIKLAKELEILRNPPEEVLEGEVFIVTKGGQNYKLGLVEIMVFPLDQIKGLMAVRDQQSKEAYSSTIESVRKAYENREDKWQILQKAYHDYSTESEQRLSQAKRDWEDAKYQENKVIEQNEYYRSGEFYFAMLPEPIMTTKTNSDGRFKLRLSTKEQFAIMARGQRQVGVETDKYFWAIQTSLNGHSLNSIQLSNDNMTISKHPDSLIQTRK